MTVGCAEFGCRWPGRAPDWEGVCGATPSIESYCWGFDENISEGACDSGQHHLSRSRPTSGHFGHRRIGGKHGIKPRSSCPGSKTDLWVLMKPVCAAQLSRSRTILSFSHDVIFILAHYRSLTRAYKASCVSQLIESNVLCISYLLRFITYTHSIINRQSPSFLFSCFNLYLLMMAHSLEQPWHLHDLDAWQDPDLVALASRTVAHLSIEFLQTNGVKPHVVFNLKANATLQQPDPEYKGVRLSMEWHSEDEFETGRFEIDPLPYADSSRSARGAFDFPLLKKNLTIRDWCQIIRGRYQGLPPQHTSDLTRFRFVVAPSDKMDGCRDFM